MRSDAVDGLDLANARRVSDVMHGVGGLGHVGKAPVDAPSPPPSYPIGSLVRLRSGGPAMTVTDMEDDYRECSWFVGNDLLEAWLPVATIESAPANATTEELERAWGQVNTKTATAL